MLLLGWPLNNFIARRSVRIQKGVLASRDKRMGVLNELIGAVSVGPMKPLLPFVMLIYSGQIHQILRLGRTMDPAGLRLTGVRNQVDD